MRDFGLKAKRHVAERVSSYFFVLVLFAVGVALGAVAISALSFSQKQDLLSFLQQIFSAGMGVSAGSSNFLGTLLVNLQLLWVVWLMGVLVFGLPVIVVLVFFRGFILGFSVAFLLSEMAWKGALFAFCSIIPHNAISVPVALAAAAIAIHHAISTIRPTNNRRQSYWQKIVSLTGLMLLFSALVFLASVVEAFITPLLAQLAARLFY
ncbi:MAG: stage II sporulation protein M [Bacillota bacterium]|jgi:stage II sporulation protein M